MHRNLAAHDQRPQHSGLAARHGPVASSPSPIAAGFLAHSRNATPSQPLRSVATCGTPTHGANSSRHCSGFSPDSLPPVRGKPPLTENRNAANILQLFSIFQNANARKALHQASVVNIATREEREATPRPSAWKTPRQQPPTQAMPELSNGHDAPQKRFISSPRELHPFGPIDVILQGKTLRNNRANVPVKTKIKLTHRPG